MDVQLDLVGMVVADMGKSLAFYRHLGLDIPAGADAEPHVEVSLPGGLRLAWDTVETVRSFEPDYVHPAGPIRMSLAFKCGSPAEVDAVYAKLVGLGYAGHREPWDAFWGQRYAVVEDPDGNTADLFCPNA
ncbi:VOC family protein [Allokutzneria multivorans]|uniref:VOC family protein n=1 Tax=Allokutzneria multivorans TaxID=1142134 RepID=A0ABP7T3K1_9PSEU